MRADGGSGSYLETSQTSPGKRKLPRTKAMRATPAQVEEENYGEARVKPSVYDNVKRQKRVVMLQPEDVYESGITVKAYSLKNLRMMTIQRHSIKVQPVAQVLLR
jgi:hypothetical protein